MRSHRTQTPADQQHRVNKQPFAHPCTLSCLCSTSADRVRLLVVYYLCAVERAGASAAVVSEFTKYVLSACELHYFLCSVCLRIVDLSASLQTGEQPVGRSVGAASHPPVARTPPTHGPATDQRHRWCWWERASGRGGRSRRMGSAAERWENSGFKEGYKGVSTNIRLWFVVCFHWHFLWGRRSIKIIAATRSNPSTASFRL